MASCDLNNMSDLHVAATCLFCPVIELLSTAITAYV